MSSYQHTSYQHMCADRCVYVLEELMGVYVLEELTGVCMCLKSSR
jgi:hypothetical protein